MRLIDDFRWVWKNAWSVRFNVIGALFGGIAATLGVLAARDVALPIGPITLSVLLGAATAGASLAALAARFVKQDRPNPDASE
jgi:hypothetical protein